MIDYECAAVCLAQHPEPEAAGVNERRWSQVVVTAADGRRVPWCVECLCHDAERWHHCSLRRLVVRSSITYKLVWKTWKCWRICRLSGNVVRLTKSRWSVREKSCLANCLLLISPSVMLVFS